MIQIDERAVALAVRGAEERIRAHQDRTNGLRRASGERPARNVRWRFLGLG